MKAFVDEHSHSPLRTIWNFHKEFTLTLATVIPFQIIAAASYSFFFGIQGIREWEWKTKPLPMLLIILTASAFVFFYGTNILHTFVTLGLVLSLIGDVILMSETPEQFLLGLGVFLIAHIFYIIAFSIPPKRGYPPIGLHLKRALPFALIFSIVPRVLTSSMLKEENPDTIMVFAVYVYGFILAMMGWRAAARIGYPKETLASQVIALVGALFFMTSDFLLAFNRFHTPIPYAQVWVLTTYWIGQTAIVISLQRIPWDRKIHQVEDLDPNSS